MTETVNYILIFIIVLILMLWGYVWYQRTQERRELVRILDIMSFNEHSSRALPFETEPPHPMITHLYRYPY